MRRRGIIIAGIALRSHLSKHCYVHMSDLAYATHILALSGSYREMLQSDTAAVGMRIIASKANVKSALTRGSQRKSVLLGGEPWRVLKNSSNLAQFLLQTVRAPKRSESNPVFGRGVKYSCLQRTGSTRQWRQRFCSTIAKRGLFPTKLSFKPSLTMTASSAVYT